MIEVTYIDRLHLAKTLRIWRFVVGELINGADLGSFTNHRIDQRDISAGIRTCNGRPEIIVVSADRSQLVSVAFDGAEFQAETLGRDTSRPAFANAMVCKDS